MKIAVSGKGGVGKTTLVSALARTFMDEGRNVIAIDADPDANLASALGFPGAADVVPVRKMKELIYDRTESSRENYGKFFKLNPKVSDLPERLAIEHDGIKLITLGAVYEGGGGCACPENVFLKSLLTHLILGREEVVIVDMEAGIEHLGRASVDAVDALIVVIEPGMQSVQTFFQIVRLADEIGVRSVFAVLNKVANARQRKIIEDALGSVSFLGCISFNGGIAESDLMGGSVFDDNGVLVSETGEIVSKLRSKLKEELS